MTSPRDPVEVAVTAVRDGLTRILWARVLLQSFGSGLATWLMLTLFQMALATDASFALARAIIAGFVALACAVVLARGQGSVSLLRTALWMEEHASSGYALVTWVEQLAGNASPAFALPPKALPSPALQRVVAQSSRASLAIASKRLGPLARSQLAGPLLFCAGAAVIVWLAWRTSISPPLSESGLPFRAAAEDARRAAPIGAWQVHVTPPGYTGQPARALGNVGSVRALSGTRIDVRGGDALPDSVRVLALSDSVSHGQLLTLESLGSGWQIAVVAANGPLEVRVWRDRFVRLLLVEGVPDSLPVVVLELPTRDSVLRRAEGVLPLLASLHDDLGLARGAFEVVISAGDGERFTVRSLRLGDRSMGGAHDGTLRASLDLRALQLGPGDVLHLRAVARDAHPSSGREAGTSETRSFRIARASEYDSIAVEPAPPPAVDKSLLSQRMLLMLTERLEQRRPRVSAMVVRDESRRLAGDQARLRQAVGDAVFQRLTGDGGGEHSHFAGDGHDHGVEAVGGKLALSGVNAQGMLEEGDDAPVLAINKPLLEAYNAMWDAGQSLEQADPLAAIPYMRLALEAIERARAASRLYLRGRPPTVIIDLAKVRLAGKDTASPDTRVARASIPSRSAIRESRLLAAAALATSDASAARDTVAVLRLESLADDPAFAQALSSLLDAFVRGSGADVTVPFLRARRVLGGITRIPLTTWSRGGPP